jgi:hypothetical protein
MPVKHARSCLALIQFVAMLQIFVGWIVLPAEMHSGDSAIETVIMNAPKDEQLRAHIMQWHDGEVILAARWIVSLGVIQLVISTVTVLVMNRATDAASKRTRPDATAV